MQGGMGGTSGMQRPTGVTVLAVVAAIGGVLGLLTGLGFVAGGGFLATYSAAAGGLVTLTGLVLLVLGIVDLALAYGFWTLKPWAWQWGIVLQVVSVVIAILEVPVLGTSFTNIIIPLIIAAVIVYYLNLPDIRKVFGAPEKGWPFIGGM